MVRLTWDAALAVAPEHSLRAEAIDFSAAPTAR
jgi:hypothetical protein